MIYFASRHTSKIRLTRPVNVTCEKCGTRYGYEMVREASAMARAPFLIGRGMAKNRAEDAAFKAVGKKLKIGIEPVACPHCGWYQPDMVGEIRRRETKWLLGVGIVVPAIAGGAALIRAMTLTRAFDWPISGLPRVERQILIALVATTVAIPAVALVACAMVRRRIDPNRAYPGKPVPYPGAPVATAGTIVAAIASERRTPNSAAQVAPVPPRLPPRPKVGPRAGS